MQTLWGRPVIPHQCVKGAVLSADNAGLDITSRNQRRAGVPGLTPVIADVHQGKRKPIRVERDDEPPTLEHKRMRAGEPADASREFIRRLAAQRRQPCVNALPTFRPERGLVQRGRRVLGERFDGVLEFLSLIHI